MTTLSEKIEALELPQPVQGEALIEYARRVAYIGGLVGEQHALVHRQPVTVYVQAPEPPKAEPKAADVDIHAQDAKSKSKP